MWTKSKRKKYRRCCWCWCCSGMAYKQQSIHIIWASISICSHSTLKMRCMCVRYVHIRGIHAISANENVLFDVNVHAWLFNPNSLLLHYYYSTFFGLVALCFCWQMFPLLLLLVLSALFHRGFPLVIYINNIFDIRDVYTISCRVE